MEIITNRDKGKNIREKINQNFSLALQNISNNVLALPAEKRQLLTESYLSIGLIVYDTTAEKWFKYTASGWVDWYPKGRSVSMSLSNDSWTNGMISIPCSSHKIEDPIVQLYILTTNNTYDVVLGGVSIDSSYNITLHSDVPFQGKVVIK